MFYNEGGEAVEQVDKRSCRCPIPGSVRSQVAGILRNLISQKMSLPIAGS